MTFSILAADGDGAVGMAVASSSPAVAARCIHLRAGVGGVASQNITDPRLGTVLLDKLEAGHDVRGAMEEVVHGRELIEYRQLSVLDIRGEGAVHSGAETLGVHFGRVGGQVVAAGNMLADIRVVDACIDGFEASDGELEMRLMTALEAGLAAGGEEGPIHSSGMAVVRAVSWRETDLRVDWSAQPVADLRKLVEMWLPQRDDYVTRGLNPAAAPSYGVPGNE